MERRRWIIAASLVFAVAAASMGIGQGVYAAEQNGTATAQQTSVKTKSVIPYQKTGKLSKRNQAKVDKNEQVRLRLEKIQIEQGK